MDLLSDILSHLRMRGTLYFRTSFTSPWGVKVPDFENVARFHFAHKGRCFVRIKSVDDPVFIEQGDLIIITRGAAHTLYCDPTTEDQAMMLDQVVEKSGFDGSGALVYGEQGTNQETQLICGHFAFDKKASHPLIHALPPYIHIKNYGEAAGIWMENTLKVIGLEAGRQALGSDLIALKMSEIIFAQALRTYLATDGLRQSVLAGFADPNIARTLQAIHSKPEHSWTMEELSTIAGKSRTSFMSKFSECLSLTPFEYVTHWRMQIARQRLEETNYPIIEIAESVGYHSEAAFSRVFKKQFQSAPATYRRAIRA
ncbi:AraC family transcriptional regulator [Sneathiella marina]|uniref:AraC family transcriptional regulator n=1 Tax=Sneathiella marina TaxID=2950108 RepID=A0ABY4VXT8_9PROT|nr:AraC family transcriptional regulator [Sneathiella marina]USG59743.1 AraC family transcriptional regulator [Sneathiella marina]